MIRLLALIALANAAAHCSAEPPPEYDGSNG
jgi:hypothetical protein